MYPTQVVGLVAGITIHYSLAYDDDVTNIAKMIQLKRM